MRLLLWPTSGDEGATIAQSLPALTQSAAGTVEAPPPGTRVRRGRGALLGVLGTPTAGSAAVEAITGTVTQSLPPLGQAATGEVTEPQTRTARGRGPLLGVLGSPTGGSSEAVPGSHAWMWKDGGRPKRRTARIAQTLPALGQAATGTVKEPARRKARRLIAAGVI